ncbi:hypothetical protein [Streptomyces sp. SCL15-6]|uniref:hypothetical protein n=1 Tax=Streptomyces sp. SCL15-6 TaxID=2967222 RepID=UPI0029668159|nr:hypothetical protein [Streptomyces sp. SCL15-6]
MSRRRRTRTLLTLLTLVCGSLLATLPAGNAAAASRCVTNWSGYLCLNARMSGNYVSSASASLEYTREGDRCWIGGQLPPHETHFVFMYFTLYGTLADGSVFKQSGQGKCGDGEVGESYTVEHKTFVPARNFKSGSKLCLRADYQSPTTSDPTRACVTVP